MNTPLYRGERRRAVADRRDEDGDGDGDEGEQSEKSSPRQKPATKTLDRDDPPPVGLGGGRRQRYRPDRNAENSEPGGASDDASPSAVLLDEGNEAGEFDEHELSMQNTSRRQAHIASEQKRRQNINVGFEELRQAIPSSANTSDSKAIVLKKALLHISYLHEEVRRLRAMVGEELADASHLATAPPPTQNAHQTHQPQLAPAPLPAATQAHTRRASEEDPGAARAVPRLPYLPRLHEPALDTPDYYNGTQPLRHHVPAHEWTYGLPAGFQSVPAAHDAHHYLSPLQIAAYRHTQGNVLPPPPAYLSMSYHGDAGAGMRTLPHKRPLHSAPPPPPPPSQEQPHTDHNPDDYASAASLSMLRSKTTLPES